MKKMLIGILMIGSLMFVGCSNQELPEGTIIESTRENELAVDIYGNDLVLGYTEIPLNEYMPKVSIKKITLDRYNDILKLPEGTLDTEIAKSRAVDYLMEETDKLPNELVKNEETTEEPVGQPQTEEQPKDNVKEYVGNNDDEVVVDQGDANPQTHPWLFNGECCPTCGSRDYDKETGICQECIDRDSEYGGDIPIYRICDSCGKLYELHNYPSDPWYGYCPVCEEYYSTRPASGVDSYCSQCGLQEVDRFTGVCRNCGNHEW